MKVAGAPIRSPVVASVVLERVRARVDLRMLIARGWDPQTRVFAPAPDDALFGYHPCERLGCPRAGQQDRSRALGLCDSCTRIYLRRLQGKDGAVPVTLERFKALPMLRVAQADREERLCLVCCTLGHERSAGPQGLCPQCNKLRAERRQTTEQHVAGDERFGPGVPRLSFGRCLVDGCRRWAVTDEGLCKACRDRLRRLAPARRPSMSEFIALGPWRPPFDGKTAAMPEVPELVEW